MRKKSFIIKQEREVEKYLLQKIKKKKWKKWVNDEEMKKGDNDAFCQYIA